MQLRPTWVMTTRSDGVGGGWGSGEVWRMVLTHPQGEGAVRKAPQTRPGKPGGRCGTF